MDDDIVLAREHLVLGDAQDVGVRRIVRGRSGDGRVVQQAVGDAVAHERVEAVRAGQHVVLLDAAVEMAQVSVVVGRSDVAAKRVCHAGPLKTRRVAKQHPGRTWSFSISLADACLDNRDGEDQLLCSCGYKRRRLHHPLQAKTSACLGKVCNRLAIGKDVGAGWTFVLEPIKIRPIEQGYGISDCLTCGLHRKSSTLISYPSGYAICGLSGP